ncbi:lipopolysaccharide assembly protein LapA domain-containing protein [Zavarzinia sp. CC-PAN008]|uniref:lipopolysaccharide assembly protein LapA domain-containing protein n=1 Tax=Zavarzinia sp. CC-PAN008 TaxID=3243332 RepID=UPI003F747E71
MRILTWFIVPPAIVAGIVLAIANRTPTTFSIDPFAPGSAAWSVTVPLYLIIFGAVLVGIVLGGTASLFARARANAHARDARIKAQVLQRELNRAAPPAAAPTTLPAVRT